MSEFSLPSWSDVLKAPSVVPSTVPTTPTTSFELPPGFFNSSSAPAAPAATSVPTDWKDWANAIGMGLDAAGTAIRAYRGELPPGSYGSGPFGRFMAEQEEAAREKEDEEKLAKLLEKIRNGESGNEYITKVLDPTKKADPQNPGEQRMAGTLDLPGLMRLPVDPFRG